MYAICYTKPNTTLTFWLNRFSCGGFIWSLVRSRNIEGQLRNDQEWDQPALRFPTREEADHFIQTELAGDPLAVAAQVED